MNRILTEIPVEHNPKFIIKTIKIIAFKKGPKVNIKCSMDDVWGYFWTATRHNASYSDNKSNIKMRSFKSSENSQEKECRPDRFVSNNNFSLMTLN